MAPSCPWNVATSALQDFCEPEVCGWLLEPGNSLSNIAFVICGVFIIRRSQTHYQSYLAIIGWVAIITGIASGLYHGTGLSWAGEADLWAMFLGTGMMTALNLRRWMKWSYFWISVVGLATTVSLISLSYLFPQHGRVIYALGAPCLLIELRLFILRRHSISYSNFVRAWLLSLAGLAFWWLDSERVWCEGYSHFLSGHILWHVLCAISIYYFFLFYEQFPVFSTERGNA